eukprot:31177-Pelagococcus_subviridis.AAC.17
MSPACAPPERVVRSADADASRSRSRENRNFASSGFRSGRRRRRRGKSADRAAATTTDDDATRARNVLASYVQARASRRNNIYLALITARGCLSRTPCPSPRGSGPGACVRSPPRPPPR